MRASFQLILWTAMTLWLCPQAVAIEYRIPLPERTYSGEWRFSIEAVSQTGLSNTIVVRGYDNHGDLVMETEPQQLWMGRVYRFVLTGANPDRVQSVALTSDMALHGFVWIENHALGQINGVRLENAVSSELFLPHIPRNYFKWKVSFALMGVDRGIGVGDIEFDYFNDVEAVNYSEPVSQDLEDFAYLRRTPNHDFLTVGLGTDAAASWGLLRSSTDHFQLTGYQTFARLDGSLQTCAMTLSSDGASSGVVVFSPPGIRTYDDFFVFVNPGDEPVEVDFSLVGSVEHDGVHRIDTATQRVVIEAHAKRINILGSDLFADFSGIPRMLSYQAHEPNNGVDPPRAAPIEAIHLQSERRDQALGGHFFSNVGNHLQAWMTFEGDWRSVLELANVGQDPTTVVMTLTRNGTSRVVTLDLARGEVDSIDDTDILEYLDESSESMQGQTVLINIRTSAILTEEALQNGTIAGKLLLFSGTDVAIVNPIVGRVSD